MAGITDLTTGMTGAEFRTAFNSNFAILPKVYNVKDYGAVGNGITDDTVAIQLTINTCFDEGGGIVYLPKGVYIISGALQTSVEYDSETIVNPNSQLYIPPKNPYDLNRRTILIKGEVAPPYSPRRIEGDFVHGSTLKSTIAGSGDFPSVIGSVGPTNAWTGDLNYTCCYIEDLTILVHHDSVNGITVGGINFIRVSHTQINNVMVTCDHYANSTLVQPTAKVFGIGVGFYLDDFPIIGRAFVYRGFYYGFVLGEGVHCQNITSMRNLNGIMFLNSSHGCLIDFATIHWCTNTIAAQDETIYGVSVGSASININSCSIETDEDPAWTHLSVMVLDSSNYLCGEMNCNCNATLPLTKTGGRNLFINDQSKVGKLHTWTTATRPSVINTGFMGWNSTTSKFEAWDGTGWVDLH